MLDLRWILRLTRLQQRGDQVKVDIIFTPSHIVVEARGGSCVKVIIKSEKALGWILHGAGQLVNSLMMPDAFP